MAGLAVFPQKRLRVGKAIGRVLSVGARDKGGGEQNGSGGDRESLLLLGSYYAPARPTAA